MDQDLVWFYFGQRKAKITALQKLVTRKEKSFSTGKEPFNRCKKAKSKRERRTVTKKTSVTISLPKMEVLKKKDRKHFGEKHRKYHSGKGTMARESLLSETDVVGTAAPCGPRRVVFRPSDIPPMSQLRCLVKNNFRHEEEVGRHKWSEGHMLWGKLGNYPFWPCMVSRDPFSKLFTKEVGPYKTSQSFHVQFFGANAERNWINEASLVEYEGRAKFMEVVQYGLRDPEKSSRSPDDFKVSSTWFPSWSLAVAEAEAAFKLNVEARMHRYTFQYMIVQGKAEKPVEELLKMVASKSRGRLRAKNETSGNDNDDTDNTDISFCNEDFSMRSESLRYDSDDIYSSDESSSSSSAAPDNRRVKIAVRKGSLDVFLSKHVQFVQIEHPDWKYSWIVEHLTQQWSLMSEQQRSRYTIRKTKHVSVDVKKAKKQVPEIIDNISEADPHKLNLQILKLSRKCRFVKSSGLCFVCNGQGTNLVCCKGTCGRHYHTSCVQDVTGSDDFMCPECSRGSCLCFACKKPAHDAVQCSGNCKKYYHEMCVRDLKLTIKDVAGLVCPLHTCVTCAVDGRPDASKGPFLECVRCPTAFHASDFCVGAGSKILGKGLVVCAVHFTPNKKNSQHLRVNLKHCLECGRGGSLLSCQTCPAAYHEDCAEQMSDEVDIKQPRLDSTLLSGSLPAGRKSWLCPQCLRGRNLLYGEIVWVKHGVYRWWPSEICHPEHVPRNVQERRHEVGEFPVRFFGSHDFAWVHLGRVISFDRGSRRFRSSLTTSMDKVFIQAVKEAIVAERFCSTVERTM